MLSAKMRVACAIISGACVCGVAAAVCIGSLKSATPSNGLPAPIVLSVMGKVAETADSVEQTVFQDFSRKTGVFIHFSQSLQTVNERIDLFLHLLRSHSPEPDLIDMDVIWPATLGSELLDLRPYFQEEIKSFPPELLRNFVVDGRLIALPTFVDAGVLYYRPDLLRKYRYPAPPRTWDEMEKMATHIQAAERRAGNTDLWGYVWQGGAYEALTCNALEWQASEGAGEILERNRTIQVRNPQFRRALQRAMTWIGTISPPGTSAFTEDDSLNFWKAGKAVFMRNWTGEYKGIVHAAGPVRDHTAVTALPGGIGGPRGTLGGSGTGISKYSLHPEQSRQVLRMIVSEATQRDRAIRGGYIPPGTKLQESPDVMAYTSLHGDAASLVIRNVVARPALQSGNLYSRVSRAYYTAIHAALARQITADQAISQMERELVKITGFHVTAPIE